jgi:hypothetical protein
MRRNRLVTLALPLVLLLGCAGDEEPEVDGEIELPDADEGDADGLDEDEGDEPAADDAPETDEPGDSEPADEATDDDAEPETDDGAAESADDDGAASTDDASSSSACRQEGDVWMYEDGDELLMFGDQSSCEHYASQ